MEIWVTLGCDALQVKFSVYIWKYLGKPGRCVPSMFNAKILGYLPKHYDHERSRGALEGVALETCTGRDPNDVISCQCNVGQVTSPLGALTLFAR